MNWTGAVMGCALIAGMAMAPLATFADVDTSKPIEVVEDSIITTKIKSKLAAEYPKTATQINVDTDNAGNVYLRGYANSVDVASKAVSIASATEGVKSVNSEITVKPD